MLVFITTIRHPKNSNSYAKIEALLSRTLKSVCNQNDKAFRVIVVCNQLPQVSFNSPYVDFVTVDFPAPSDQKGAELKLEDCKKDKATKIVTGLLHAQQYQPDYFMLLDSDDLVSNKIVSYVNSQPKTNGWYVERGFIYGDGGALVRGIKSFHRRCGTSHILNWQLIQKRLNLPEEFPTQPTQAQIMENVEPEFLRKTFATHWQTRRYFNKSGFPLKQLPFPAAIWVLDTGENRSGKSLLNFGYPVSNRLKQEFSLTTPELSPSLVVNYLTKLPMSARTIGKKVLERLQLV